MKRSLEQNDCLHKWTRVIADHLQDSGVAVSHDTVKELILLELGNTKTVKVPGLKERVIPMRSHQYKQMDFDLNEYDRKNNFISMNALLSKVEAWAATDLNLQLEGVKSRARDAKARFIADDPKTKENEAYTTEDRSDYVGRD